MEWYIPMHHSNFMSVTSEINSAYRSGHCTGPLGTGSVRLVPTAQLHHQILTVTMQLMLSLTLHRALRKDYLTHDMIEMMDPIAMFAIPRLAIIW